MITALKILEQPWKTLVVELRLKKAFGCRLILNIRKQLVLILCYFALGNTSNVPETFFKYLFRVRRPILSFCTKKLYRASFCIALFFNMVYYWYILSINIFLIVV